MKTQSFLKLTLFALAFLPTLALAGTTVISQRNENWSNPECSGASPLASCDLPSARFRELKKKFSFEGEPARYATWMTDMSFGYSPLTPNLVESFGIVQFVRGCVFHSDFAGGQVTRSLTVQRKHLGRTVTFQHRNWQIDSETTDPLLSSDEDFGRFGLLRWNPNPASLNPETATWYVNQKPSHGSVFMSLLVSGAVLHKPDSGPDASATNSSLEYKTCVFRLSDLPDRVSSGRSSINLARALKCWDWSHKYVWDFKRKTMTSPRQIESICQVARD